MILIFSTWDEHELKILPRETGKWEIINEKTERNDIF